jgi:outer membrane protein assembly factor BamB
MLDLFRRTAAAAAGLVLIAAAIGCASSDQPGQRASDDDRRAPDRAQDASGDFERLNRQTNPIERMGWVLDWSAKASENADVVMLVPAGDVLFIQNANNVLTVRDAGTGAFRWSDTLGNPLINFLGHVRADNVNYRPLGEEARRLDLVLSCAETELFVRELGSGTLLSRQRLLHICSTEPVLIGDELVLGGLQGDVLFHDFARGLYTERFGMGEPITVAPGLIGTGDLAFVAETGDVAIIDADNAEPRGRLFNMYAGSEHPPATDERAAYVASRDQSIYAFDAVSGERRWRIRTERRLDSPPVVWNDRVFVAVPDSGLLCIDARRGDVLWTAEGLDRGEVIGVLAGEVIFWDGRTMSLLDTNTGDIIEQSQLPFAERIVADGFEDPALYVLTRGNDLLRFRVP